MSSRRIASHANLVPVQEKTIEPFSTFNSDKVNKLTRIVSNGDDGVTHGLEIKNSNDQIDSIRDIMIVSSGNMYVEQNWILDSNCTVEKETNGYLQGFKITNITEPCVKTIQYNLVPSRCKFDFKDYIGKNVKLRFNFYLKLNCGSPRKIIASVNDDSVSVDYPRYRTDNLKFTVIHNLINDKFQKTGIPEPLQLKLAFVLDPEDGNSCYKDDINLTCYNGQSQVCFNAVKIDCQVLSHEEKIFDYTVLDGDTYDYPTTYVHPTHKLYVTPGVAIKDDIVLDEKGRDINKSTPTMVLDLCDPKSWIKSNPFVYSDFYKQGANQYAYVLNCPTRTLKLIGGVNTGNNLADNNLEFTCGDTTVSPIDDFETSELDKVINIPATQVSVDNTNETVGVEITNFDVDAYDYKDLFGNRAYAVSKTTGKIIKIFDLEYDSENYEYANQTLKFTFDELVYNVNESFNDQIELRVSVGPIKVSGNVSEINPEMVKWANVVIYYSYFKHPEPNTSYIGLVRDEDLKDGMYGEDYLVLGRVRFISPNTVDLITYANRQQFKWWSDKAQNIAYGDQIPLEVQKLWLNPHGKLDIPTSVSDALSKIIKWIPEFFNVIRRNNKVHKNVVDNDVDSTIYMADGKYAVVIEKEQYNETEKRMIYDQSDDRAQKFFDEFDQLNCMESESADEYIDSITDEQFENYKRKNTRGVTNEIAKIKITDISSLSTNLPQKLIANGPMLSFLGNSNNYTHPQYMKLNSDNVYSVASLKEYHIRVVNGSETRPSYRMKNITGVKFYINNVEVTSELGDSWYTFEDDNGGYFNLRVVKDGYTVHSVRTCYYSLDYSTIALFPTTACEGFRTVLNWGMIPYDLDSHMYVYNMCGDQIQHAWYDNRGDYPEIKTSHLQLSSFNLVIDTDDSQTYGQEITTVEKKEDDYLDDKTFVYTVDNFNMVTDSQRLTFTQICKNKGFDPCTITDDQMLSLVNYKYKYFDKYREAKGVQDFCCLTKQQKMEFITDTYNGNDIIGKKSNNIRAKVTVTFDNNVYEIVAPDNVTGKYWHVYHIIDGKFFIDNYIDDKEKTVIDPLAQNSDPREAYDYASDMLSRGLSILPEDNVDWVLLKNENGDNGITKNNYSLGYYDSDNYFVECYYSNNTGLPISFFDRQNETIVKLFDVSKTIEQNEEDTSKFGKYAALLYSKDVSGYSEKVDLDSTDYVLPFIHNVNPKTQNTDNVIKKGQIKENGVAVDLTASRLLSLLDRIHSNNYYSDLTHDDGTIPMWKTVNGKGSGYLTTCTYTKNGSVEKLRWEDLLSMLDRIPDGENGDDNGLAMWTSKNGKGGYLKTSPYNFESTLISGDVITLAAWNESLTRVIKSKISIRVQSNINDNNTLMSLKKDNDTGDYYITNADYTVDSSTDGSITNESNKTIATTLQLAQLLSGKMNTFTATDGQVVSYLDKIKSFGGDWILNEGVLIVQNTDEENKVRAQNLYTGDIINTNSNIVYKYDLNTQKWVEYSQVITAELTPGRFAYNAVTNKFYYIDTQKRIVCLNNTLSLDGRDYGLQASIETQDGKLAVWTEGRILQTSQYNVKDVFEFKNDSNLMIGQLKYVARKNLKEYYEYADDYNGWVYPDGRSLSKTNFSEAFAVWGYTYGGSGEMFKIPNLYNIVQIHHGDNGKVTNDGTELLDFNTTPANASMFKYNAITGTWNLSLDDDTTSTTKLERNRIPTLIYIGKRNRPTSSLYFDVKFLNEDGSVISSQSVRDGWGAVEPEHPTKPGYTFEKWDTNDFVKVTQNLNVKAVFKQNEYTVRFIDGVTNEVVGTPQKVLGGKSAFIVSHPAHIGYSVSATFEDKYSTTDFQAVYRDMDVKLLYIQNTYTITFKIDNENVYKIYENVPGGTYFNAPNGPIQEGYDFTGWTNASKLACVGEDIVCVGQYQLQKFRVVFKDSIDNSILETLINIPYGQGVIAPTVSNDLHEGMSFRNWSHDISSIKSNLIVLAYFRGNEIILKFKSSTGEDMREDLVCEAGSIDVNEIPVANKVGYTFNGWVTTSENCHIETYPTGICKNAYALHDATFTAQFERIFYHVKFVANNGVTVLHECDVEYGSPCAAPEPPVLEGHTFLDWAICEGASNNDLDGIYGNCTFKAVYDTEGVDVVNINYHKNFEDEVEPQPESESESDVDNN